MPFQTKKNDIEKHDEITEIPETKKSLGETIQLKRESLGLTVDDICTKTKIRKAFIIAIEKDDLEQLPGKVYIKGFLGTYMNFLGLSPDLIDDQSQSLKNKLQIKPSPFKFYVYKEESSSLTQKIFFISMILLLLIWGISKLKQSTPHPRTNIKIMNSVNDDTPHSTLSLIEGNSKKSFNSVEIEKENTIVKQRNEQDSSFTKEIPANPQDLTVPQPQKETALKRTDSQVSTPYKSPVNQLPSTVEEDEEED